MKNTNSIAFFSVVLLGILLGALAAYTHEYSTDQLQLFIRGNLLAEHGIWTHFGNPTSGGMGNVPGSLTTVLFGIPLKLWYSAYSPLVIIALSHLISFLLIDHILKAHFGIQERLIFAVIYWLNPWRIMLTGPWNPSYLFFCTALHFWSAAKLRVQPNGWASLLHVLAIGIAFQLHSSSIVLAFATVLLILTRTIRLRWGWVFIGIALNILTLLPAILILIDQSPSGAVPNDPDSFLGRGLVYVFPLLKGILYWFRYSSLLFGREIFQGIGFEWVSVGWIQQVMQYFWLFVKWPLAIGSIIFSFWVGYRSFREIKPALLRWKFDDLEIRKWILIYVFILFCAVFLASCLTPITFNHWHLILVLPICLLPLFFFLVDGLRAQEQRTKTALILLGCYFVFVGCVASLQSTDHDYRLNPQSQFQAWKNANKLTPALLRQ